MIRQPGLRLLHRDVNYTIMKLSRIEAGVIAQGFPAQIVVYCYMLHYWTYNMNKDIVLSYYHNFSHLTIRTHRISSFPVQSNVMFLDCIKPISMFRAKQTCHI